MNIAKLLARALADDSNESDNAFRLLRTHLRASGNRLNITEESEWNKLRESERIAFDQFKYWLKRCNEQEKESRGYEKRMELAEKRLTEIRRALKIKD